jgi:hypothetical protein
MSHVRSCYSGVVSGIMSRSGLTALGAQRAAGNELNTAARWRSHAVKSQDTTPSGASTEVLNLPSQRARIKFLLKSSALLFSLHCTPMP